MSRYQARTHAIANEHDQAIIGKLRNATDVLHRIDERLRYDDYAVSVQYSTALSRLVGQGTFLEWFSNNSLVSNVSATRQSFKAAFNDGLWCVSQMLKKFNMISEVDKMDVTVIGPLTKLLGFIDEAYSVSLLRATECLKNNGSGDVAKNECAEPFKLYFLGFIRSTRLENDIARNVYLSNVQAVQANMSQFFKKPPDKASYITRDLSGYNASSIQLTDLLDKVIQAVNKLLDDPTNATKLSRVSIAIETLKTHVRTQVIPHAITLITQIVNLQSQLSERYTDLNDQYKSITPLEKAAVRALTKIQKRIVHIQRIITDAQFVRLSEDMNKMYDDGAVESMLKLLELKATMESVHGMLSTKQISTWATGMVDLNEFLTDFTSEADQLKTDTAYLKPYCPEIARIHDSIDDINGLFNVIDKKIVELTELTSDYDSSYSRLISTLETFNASVQIDANFIKRNFVVLNVYYTTMSYEQIIKSQAYNLLGLICDIGGSAGLYLGASLLTILELFYFVGTKASTRVEVRANRAVEMSCENECSVNSTEAICTDFQSKKCDQQTADGKF
ncbi:uncharacterized protein LOC141913015 [Tubulanus polymorphus]|uniref:uncharacterized protein LOC141913015 n=1 Tax=Tubulanus polymorphus TaxID=672921 RepID=UPI003DA279EA